MAAPTDGFWSDLGPWLLGGLVTLIGVIWVTMRDDVQWLKRNLTKVLIELGIKPE